MLSHLLSPPLKGGSRWQEVHGPCQWFGSIARDPDALVDLVELELTDEIIQQRCDQLACDIYKDAINRMNRPYMEQYIGLDDLRSPYQMRNHFEKAVVNIQDRWQTNELINREQARFKRCQRGVWMAHFESC